MVSPQLQSSSPSFSPTLVDKGDSVCACVQWHSAFVTMMVAGQMPPDPVLSSIMHALQELTRQNAVIAERIQSLEDTLHCEKRRRVTVNPVGVVSPTFAVAGSSSSSPEVINWICPFCLTRLADRDSWKGHIRRLVNPSSRPACHMNPQDSHHLDFVKRFGFVGDMFHQKAREFTAAFYAEVCICCTSQDTDQQSYDHISLWLSTALTANDEFPIYDISQRATRTYKRMSSSVTPSSSSYSRSRERGQ